MSLENPKSGKEAGFLLVLLLAGGMMLTHGISKIGLLFGDGPVQIVDPFGDKELSLLFFTVFLSVLISGGGRLSVDQAIGGRKKK